MRRCLPSCGLWAAVLATAVATVGCQAPSEPAGPTVVRVSVANDEEFGVLWESAADVLRTHNLWPDRQDRHERIITTFPDTSPSWFEFWRPFPTSEFDWWEANLQTVQRSAEVTFKPTDIANEYDMSVQVDVSRYRTIERQATSSASAFQIFGARLPTAEGRTEPRQASAYWIPLGRDAVMESALAERIVRRYESDRAAAPPTTQPATAP